MISGDDFLVEPLSRLHNRAGFSCGVSALDNYIQRQARQDVERNLAAVYIVTPDSKAIAAFYTLSAQSVTTEQLPEAHAAKLPKFPLPVTLLGRMAVDTSYQRRGLGEFVLLNALKRALCFSHDIASWAVIVDAKEGARSFYVKFGFLPFLDHPDRLFLPIRSIAALFKEAGA